MSIVSEKPLIEILSPEEQHDRFDINYYLPEFIHAERYIENCDIELTTLGDVMTDDASYGVLPPSSSYLEEGGISLVRSSNVTNRGIDCENAVRVPSEWINSERARIKSNDVLISIKGARAFFDMCVASDNPPDAIVNGSIFRFQCKEDYDPNFVTLWLLSAPIQSLVYRERANLGISYISLETLQRIPFPKLTKNVQREILLRARDLLEQINIAIEDLASTKELLQSMFSDVFYQNLHIEPISEKTKSKFFITSKSSQCDRLDVEHNRLLPIVQRWLIKNGEDRFVSMSSYVELDSETKNPEQLKEEHFQYIDIGSVSVSEKRITQPTTLAVSDAPSRARKHLKKGNLIVSTVRPQRGAFAIIGEKQDGAIGSTGFCQLKCKNGTSDEFVRYLLWTSFVNTQIELHCSGASYPAINEQDILDLNVPAASNEEQLDIARRCQEIESKTVAEIQNLDAIGKEFHRLVKLITSDVLALRDESQFDFYLDQFSQIKKRSQDLEALQ
ncbi:TPA: hypothetical protein RQM99_003379 [Aeromonas dhakensis]|uniref:hypothetical protein n=1 Tax=Aeromonas hydrophila TaxID=644 RepID=UPI002890DE3E|nr:hypothetical protein [Aeromonas hydrophila]HDX8346964.1 hypothetical protein [Aeromonas dhakensis]